MNTDMSADAAELLPQVAATRERLWDAGFAPTPICNHDADRPIEQRGKAPVEARWQEPRPPRPPTADATNTGILCGGLRAVDIDVDEPTRAHRCRALALERFGEAPIRTRANSPRCLILYRAADGQPPKRTLAGKWGKVEILGAGQQFVAFGIHASGATLEWFPEAPGDISADSLPAVTEDEIDAFLADCAAIIDALAPGTINGHDHAAGDLQADIFRIAAAINAIPNTGPADWEAWNRIGMALWAATAGSAAGRVFWHAWSKYHPSYDRAATDERWDHYRTSPPTSIGAGSLFHLAALASEPPPHPGEDAATTPEPETAPLPLLWLEDIKTVLDAKDFVQGLLAEGGAGVIYGDSNAGKTFWATDLALHVAAGMRWNGRRVDQGGVIYCAMEGGNGFRNRVAAWRDANVGSLPAFLPFAAIPASINLLDPLADTQRLIDTIRFAAKQMGHPVKLVVVDTLSRALAGGNENSPEDMGALVRCMDLIRKATGAFVLFIHHSGKDAAKGARGHSLLRAAIDTEIEVKADDDTGERTATVVKQRDLAKGDAFGFRLTSVVLGQNPHGEEVTTCRVDTADVSTKKRTQKPLTDAQAGWLRDIMDLFAEPGATVDKAPVPGMKPRPTQTRDEIRVGLRGKGRFDLDTHANLTAKDRDRFRDALNQLKDRGKIGMTADLVWLL